ncbi:AAEL005067-PA [Aedes aegypti]|uniref:Protein cereblon n=1 Tax=Aedes aegypti TaxID=7159 RepID=Q17B59_AEDAE|nr:AAEL005067-PA [Aedes aegypti]
MENDDPVEDRPGEAPNQAAPFEALLNILRYNPAPGSPAAQQEGGDISDGAENDIDEETIAWDDSPEIAALDASFDDVRAWGDESSPEQDAVPWAEEGDAYPDVMNQEALVPWGEEDHANPEEAANQDADSDVSIVDGGVESSSENGMDGRSSNSSENGLDDSDADRLFDDYIQNREQQQSSDAEIYNTELPTEHAYLGKLERVEGVDYLEPGKTYCLPVYSHHSIVFPGEVVPMILNAASLNYEDQSDGVKFGLLFRTTFPNNYIYGVTCQVFERGERDLNGSIILKTIAQQRFHVVGQMPNIRAEVKILPEIILPDPLLSSCSNPMKRHAFSNNKKYSHRFKSFVSHAMTWPKFVYDYYSTEDVLTKVERYLAFLKITSVPSDPVKLSFWLARNISIDERDRKLIYQADAVISRMLIISKSLDHMCYFLCKRCDNEIGSFNDIFAMNKQGVQTSYCNPSGYVHDTLTIYKTKENSTFTVDRPSTEYSWFPGYSWQITLCSNCRQHLGWKFVATKNNYLPKSFYGLSGNSIKVKSVTEASTSSRDGDDVETDEGGDAQEADQLQQRLRRIQRMEIGEVLLNIDDDDDDDENYRNNEDLYQVINFSPEIANAAVQADAPLMVEGIADEEAGEDEEDEDRFQDARE